MGLFSVNYQNVPGQCVYAQGGLKFHADEEALVRYFAPILPYVSLNNLIGEAVFWVLLPSTLSIWTFAFLLYTRGILFAVITTIALYLFVEIGHMVLYIKPLNYVVFILGNRILQLVAYIVLAVILVLSGSILKTIILGGWFLFFAVGLNQLILLPLIPILTKIFSLPPSDQVLRNVGWHYARKLGIDPTKWKMYDRETGNGG